MNHAQLVLAYNRQGLQLETEIAMLANMLRNTAGFQLGLLKRIHRVRNHRQPKPQVIPGDREGHAVPVSWRDRPMIPEATPVPQPPFQRPAGR